MNNDVIASDQPFSESQRAILVALADTLLPGDETQGLPGAGELDFAAYLSGQPADLQATIASIIEYFDLDFTDAHYNERSRRLQDFSDTEPETFRELLLAAYACYYQNDRVLVGIGLAEGPPFPRGNTVEEGDLSLLNPVIAAAKRYRQ